MKRVVRILGFLAFLTFLTSSCYVGFEPGGYNHDYDGHGYGHHRYHGYDRGSGYHGERDNHDYSRNGDDQLVVTFHDN
jgi:hypothetical protein